MKKNSNDYLKYLAFITQVGITILTPIALCIFLAIFLTRKFGIGQWVIILGILLGISAGILNVYKMMTKAMKKK